jgi:hypothetical protein
MKKQEKHLVEGDHPTFRRIYDFCKSGKEAKALIKELKHFNYENIKLNGKEIK